jgi:hypothetical protein
LVVIGARGKNLDVMRILDRCGGARFLLEAADFGWIGASFRTENHESDKAIQASIARLIN